MTLINQLRRPVVLPKSAYCQKLMVTIIFRSNIVMVKKEEEEEEEEEEKKKDVK